MILRTVTANPHPVCLCRRHQAWVENYRFAILGCGLHWLWLAFENLGLVLGNEITQFVLTKFGFKFCMFCFQSICVLIVKCLVFSFMFCKSGTLGLLFCLFTLCCWCFQSFLHEDFALLICNCVIRRVGHENCTWTTSWTSTSKFW